MARIPLRTGSIKCDEKYGVKKLWSVKKDGKSVHASGGLAIARRRTYTSMSNIQDSKYQKIQTCLIYKAWSIRKYKHV